MRRTRAAAAVLTGLVLAIVPVTGPVWAQDGKLKLEVAGDGATGVTVQARNADGKRLDTLVRLVLTATAEGGRKVGPLQLEPAGEGQGFYSTGPILAAGKWTVTVQAPAPNAGKVTVEVQAKAAQSAPPAPVAQRNEAAQDGWLWRWWPAGLVLLAALAIAAYVVPAARRRRSA